MLIKSKEKIASEVYFAALNAIQQHNAMSNNGLNQSPYSIMGLLTDTIALAVQAGVVKVLENMYTNEEFEHDIGLDS